MTTLQFEEGEEVLAQRTLIIALYAPFNNVGL